MNTFAVFCKTPEKEIDFITLQANSEDDAMLRFSMLYPANTFLSVGEVYPVEYIVEA